jgi:hypothetical protein
MQLFGRSFLVLAAALFTLATGCTNDPPPCTNGGARVAGRCVYRCQQSFCEADGASADVLLDATGLDIATLDTRAPSDDGTTETAADTAADRGPACDAPRTVCAGACVDPATDVANCGACGHACPAGTNGTVSCSAGACRIACATGFADCDGDESNGCEVELATNVDHCGTCGTQCAGAANATAACIAGVCRIRCVAGYANCNMLTSDGCETGIDSNVMNCGGCGVVCPGPYAHTERTCVSGICGWRCLNPDWPYEQWTDCDGYDETGCEVNLAESCSNCGGCGQVCHGTEIVCLEASCNRNPDPSIWPSCPP